MWSPVTIITGGGRGIGRATAEVLATRGHNLVLVARSREQLEETSLELGTTVLTIPADVTDAIAMQQVVDKAIDVMGRIDAVVNNAGASSTTTIEETTPEQWRSLIEVNLSSAFYLTHAAWPHLKKSRGAVVNVTSEAARDPFESFTAYAPAKAGLAMFAKMIHLQGKAHGIRGYAVAPAMTDTAMLRGVIASPPAESTLDPVEVARVIASCICGDLRVSSGESIWVHRP